MLDRIFQTITWLIIGFIATISFIGFNSFLTTWEKIEQENTVQAVLLSSEPRTYKNVKDSIFSAYMKRLK